MDNIGRNIYTEPIICKHCTNKAPMEVIAKYDQIGESTYLIGNDEHGFDEGPMWQLVKCPACNDLQLRKADYHEFLSSEFGIEYEILYPSTDKKISGLPEDVSKAYEAAQKVKSIDSNAFGVLLGRTLELICIDQKAKGKSLYEGLKDLASKGIIPDPLAEMAQGLRELRNIGAHPNLGELTSSEIPILESLIIAILEYVYSAPLKVTLVQQKLDALKKKKKKS